ncbi:MAG: outer membrane lipoprotein carrier protein LolA [Burkholderiaceae bacterium]
MRLHFFKRLTAAFLAVSAVALPLGAHAGAIEQLKKFGSGTQSAEGSFVQTVQVKTNRPTPPSIGHFAFAKPGKFRWAFDKPYQQLIVSDGKKVYMYDKDLAQVTTRPLSEALSATPAALLFGQSDIGKLFELNESAAINGVEWLEAVPRAPDATFTKIAIGFKNNQPVAMEMSDAFGQVTKLNFGPWIMNRVGVTSDQFKFTPPAGVDIIDGGAVQ